MSSPEIQRRIESVGACLTTCVVEKDEPCQTLQDRMAADRVPGVSIAVIRNGDIERAQGFGVVRMGGAPVTAETLFQAGSISKPVAAGPPMTPHEADDLQAGPAIAIRNHTQRCKHSRQRIATADRGFLPG